MNHKKTVSVFLSAVMCFCLAQMHVSAAESAQDGITLTVSADQTDHDADDPVTVSISLQNNSGCDLTDISVKSTIPEHYRLADGSSDVLRATYIQSGSAVSAELVLIPDQTQTAPAETSASQTETVPAAKQEIRHSTASAKTEQPQTASAAQTLPETVQAQQSQLQPIRLLHLFAVLLCAAGAFGAVFFLIRKRKGRHLVLLLCAASASALAPVRGLNAAASEIKTLRTSETFLADGQTYTVTAEAAYSIESEDMQIAVAEYYEDNSEKVIAVEDVSKTEDVFSEKEIIRFLAERGFTDYPVTYDYNMDGSYTDETEASPDSDAKHPMYQTYFISGDGAVWTVFVVGKMIAANPASYNLQSDLDAQILISETETLTSYTEMGNQFYTTIPKDSAVLLKVVDQITSQKLNEFTFEEVIGL